MQNAIDSVKNGVMSVLKAANTFKIPRTSLISKIKEKYNSSKTGPQMVLSVVEEKKFADWVITCAERGFPKRKINVLEAAGSICKSVDRARNFKNAIPGTNMIKKMILRFKFHLLTNTKICIFNVVIYH